MNEIINIISLANTVKVNFNADFKNGINLICLEILYNKLIHFSMFSKYCKRNPLSEIHKKINLYSIYVSIKIKWIYIFKIIDF